MFKEQFEPRIKEYCHKNKISIIHKYNDIVKMVIYQDDNSIKDFEKYLKRKKINEDLLKTFNQESEFINWRKKYINCIIKKNNLKEELKKCRLAKRTDDLMRILPQRKYDAFPLKDKYQEIEFDSLDDNELIINFEFSNNGICNDWWYFDFSMIKMDYKLNINNKVVEKKNIFIMPKENYENKKIEYFEKDEQTKSKLRKAAFCVRNFPDYISTTMELQNGINEFTLMDKRKYELAEILDKINNYINIYTNVKVQVRNKMKSKCKEYIQCNYRTDNLLKEKIIKFLNKK